MAALPLAVTLLTSCGGGSNSNSAQALNGGTFVDSPVVGLSYVCGSHAGVTDSNGYFTYGSGDSCSFSIGNVLIGSVTTVPSDHFVTVHDAVGVGRTLSTDTRVVYLAQFLQTLDDGTVSGKINIPASVRGNLSGSGVAANTSISASNLTTLLGVAVPGKTPVTGSAAVAALNTYMQSAGIVTSAGAVTAAPFASGDLLVSRTVYAGLASTVTLGQTLPGGGVAVNDGTFPGVFKNEVPDPSFGVTSPIYIDRMSSTGTATLASFAIDQTQAVSSFASKSELALNVSTDKSIVSLMGYKSTINQLDVSNSNTAAFVDATNPVASTVPRAIVKVNLGTAAQSVISVNAYSGNNGRAAVLANGMFYMVGNAGNGNALGPGLSSLSDNTGVQSIAATSTSGITSVIGMVWGTSGSATGYQRGFALQQLPNLASPSSNYAADKTGKDDNFRGMTIFNNTLYVSKGSGSNGVNTVYQVDAAGALANNGTLSANAAITPLPGFNALSEKVAEATATLTATPHPFGMFFADANTLYVADEGDGVRIGVAGKVTTYAGLQQWKLVSGVWQLANTFQAGLLTNAAYTPAGFTWTVKADGLRNLAGVVNADGSVTLYATTSTISDELTHDLGADPNQLVSIRIGATSTPANTSFTVLRTAAVAERLGGVAIAP